MLNQETLHVHVKNPNKSKDPIRTIGIFPTFGSNMPLLIQALSEFLSPEVSELGEPDPAMQNNLRLEVMKILPHANVIGMSRNLETGPTTIILKEQQKLT
jgi:hypothetical protein